MSPEERNLVIELFDRLATLEDAQRDPEAERLIRDGLRQAPNAPYALVQTVLVQDEALKRANARIQELEAGAGAETAPRDTSFLGGMRDSLLGRRGSVPSVRSNEGAPQPSPGMSPAMSPAWRTGAPAMAPGPAPGYPPAPGPGYGPAPGYAPGPMPQGGSFLGTAAATAAGMVGGSLLMSGIRGLMGHQGGAAHAAFDPAAGSAPSPWSGGGGSSAGGELSRGAGLDDIGRKGASQTDPGSASQGLVGSGRDDVAADPGANDPSANDPSADDDLDDSDLDDLDDSDGGDNDEE
jgi:hypothetical protein